MAKYDTVYSICNELSKQGFNSRTLVYADSDKGKVETIIHRIIGDDGRNYVGMPHVMFEATKYKKDTFQAHITPVSFLTLAEALNYIGLSRSDCD